VEYPQLVDINPLPFKGIEQTADGLRIGTIERISAVGEHPLVVQAFPAVSHHCCWPPRRNCTIWSGIWGNLLKGRVVATSATRPFSATSVYLLLGLPRYCGQQPQPSHPKRERFVHR
jgi:hypothetical protein